MEAHRLTLPPGYRIESYEIIRALGKGGFGITYQAQDVQIGRMVAIKELLPDNIATRMNGSTVVPHSEAMVESWQWARERFVEEAHILAGFSHPAIVGVHRLIETNGTVYMVMDYVDGESYENRLGRIKREPSRDSLWAVMGPILGGLEEVHRAGLLHRDIKPDNILINRHGQPFLIDFGSARSSIAATMTMTSIVTHGYSPIEQYQTKGKMGPWTDIYAFGAVICRAVTGEKPPVAADRVLEDGFQWISCRNLEGYSEEFLRAVDWALRIRAEERPGSIAEWLPSLTVLGATMPANKMMSKPSSSISRPLSVGSKLSSAFYELPPADDSTGWSKKPWPRKAAFPALVLFAIFFSIGGFAAWKYREDEKKAAFDNAARIAADAAQAAEAQRRIQEHNAATARRQAQQEAENAAQQRAKDESAKLAETKRLQEKAEQDSQLLHAEELKKKESEERNRPLQATSTSPFVNTLGMKFVPVPEMTFLASQFETTSEEYGKFSSATKTSWNSRASSSKLPAVDVNLYEAKAFCEWLSTKENRNYRLPTVGEWNAIAGLPMIANPGSNTHNVNIQDWYPPKGFGNYASDVEADEFREASPAGSFQPSSYQIYDLGGNVWEWCDEVVGNPPKGYAIRGASWFESDPMRMSPFYVGAAPPDNRGPTTGFRCVLVLPAKTD